MKSYLSIFCTAQCSCKEVGNLLQLPRIAQSLNLLGVRRKTHIEVAKKPHNLNKASWCYGFSPVQFTHHPHIRSCPISERMAQGEPTRNRPFLLRWGLWTRRGIWIWIICRIPVYKRKLDQVNNANSVIICNYSSVRSVRVIRVVWLVRAVQVVRVTQLVRVVYRVQVVHVVHVV